jgi:hypothetical protein
VAGVRGDRRHGHLRREQEKASASPSRVEQRRHVASPCSPPRGPALAPDPLSVQVEAPPAAARLPRAEAYSAEYATGPAQ